MPAPIDVAPQYRPFFTAPSYASFPRQEVNIDFYDFQSDLLLTENEGEEQNYSQRLESDYCRNFNCCGRRLVDLHELLEHFEECHVRCEEDSLPAPYYEEEYSSSDASPPNSPAAPPKPPSTASPSGGSAINNNSNSTILKKKKAPVSLSDIYAANHDDSSAFDTNVLRSSPSHNYRKRSLSQYSSSNATLESMTSTPNIKKLAIATHNLDFFSELPTPTDDDSFFHHASALFVPSNTPAATTGNFMITAEELMLRKQEALCTFEQHISMPSSTSSSLSSADKPYKCSVDGCDKAYKNPNGLKYHNLHGHCGLHPITDGDKPCPKPYLCTVIGCNKRYKNLNGLKYHVEHHHLQSFLHGQYTPASTPSASNMPTPVTSPVSSPLLKPSGLESN